MRLVQMYNIVKSFTRCGGTGLPLFGKGNQDIFVFIYFTALLFYCTIIHKFIIVLPEKNRTSAK